jgi:hypothetical protein
MRITKVSLKDKDRQKMFGALADHPGNLKKSILPPKSAWIMKITLRTATALTAAMVLRATLSPARPNT